MRFSFRFIAFGYSLRKDPCICTSRQSETAYKSHCIFRIRIGMHAMLQSSAAATYFFSTQPSTSQPPATNTSSSPKT
jgi:hypothetical protein